MIKFGFRKNNFYPLMLLLFIFLRIIVDQLIKSYHPYKKNVDFLFPFLIMISQSLIGFIIYKHYSKNKDLEGKKPSNIQNTTKIPSNICKINDSKRKVVILIIFTSFFNSLGCIIRSDDVVNFGKKEENNSLLEIRIRSIQILISSLICYFTIRLNIYRHQKVSLIIISIFLFLILVVELIISITIGSKILAILICSMSCLSRSFLDVTEKYLFDYNYINIFKMLIYEGLIGIVIYILYFISNKSYQIHAKNLLNDMSEFDWSFVYFIFLIIIYLIISGLRNSYRVKTNKYYSPMSRALFESTLDPILFLYYTLKYNEKDQYYGYWLYFGFILFCLTIIAFFSLIYNDLIILFCCGLEYDTYIGITYRLSSQEFEHIINDINNDDNKNLQGNNIELFEREEPGFEISDYKFEFN